MDPHQLARLEDGSTALFVHVGGGRRSAAWWRGGSRGRGGGKSGPGVGHEQILGGFRGVRALALRGGVSN